jgi:sulfur carrier protein
VSERPLGVDSPPRAGHFLAVRVTINGEPRDIPAALTLAGLVEHLGLTDGPVAIERNREVVPRAEHPRVAIEDGDVLEIVHFVGGG